MLNLQAVLKGVNMTTSGTKVILIVEESSLNGQLEELSRVIDADVTVTIDARNIAYSQSIDPDTNKPVISYMVDEYGIVQEYTQEKLDLGMEELGEIERESLIDVEQVDFYINSNPPENFPELDFDGYRVMKMRMEDGLPDEEIAEELQTTPTVLRVKIDEYRKCVAPKAKAWVDHHQKAKKDSNVFAIKETHE